MVFLVKNGLVRGPVIMKHGFANRQSFSFTPPPTIRPGPGRRRRNKNSPLTILSLLAFLFLLNILQTNMPTDNRIRVTTSLSNETPRKLIR